MKNVDLEMQRCNYELGELLILYDLKEDKVEKELIFAEIHSIGDLNNKNLYF